MREAFVGIDAAFAKRKRLPVALCRWESGRLLPYPLRSLSIEPPRGAGNVAVLDGEVVQNFAAAAVRYVERVADELGIEIVRVGIDAPSVPCPEGQRRREAERALDEAGISCFGTPSVSQLEVIRAKVRAHLELGGAENRLPHANQLWMIVGFALFEHFSKLAPCIEVFPQATARVLGAGRVHKFKAGGVEAQLRAVARHTGWPDDGEGSVALSSIAWAPRHDCLDAYLSAWVAALDEERRVPFGKPPDDVIWVPSVESRGQEAFEPAQEPQPARMSGSPRPRPAATAQSVVKKTSGLGRLCPACGAKTFKRWPFGWDAHAAHTCTGLVGSDPGRRKREFKARFGHLFKGRDGPAMTVCIGWGSLLWDPRELPLAGRWRPDGPELPVEFARQAKDDRITLAIAEGCAPVRTYWAPLEVGSAAEARAALAAREGCPERWIGVWPGDEGDRAAGYETVAVWARRRPIDCAVWTGLPIGFRESRGDVPTADEIIGFLRRLSGEELRRAEEYVRRAPEQTRTRYRERIERELGWVAVVEGPSPLAWMA